MSRYRTVTDNYYKSPQIQEAEFKKDIGNLQVGERFVRNIHGVRRERVKPLGDVWPLGLSEMRIQQAIEQIRQHPVYQPPTLPTFAPTPAKKEPASAALRARKG